MKRPTAARAIRRDNLIGLLESRLDAVVYRAKFRADDLRRAPVRQSRPHPGQRSPGQHPVLPLQAGRCHRDQGKVPRLAIVLEASQMAERDVPDYMEVDHTKMVATYTRFRA